MYNVLINNNNNNSKDKDNHNNNYTYNYNQTNNDNNSAEVARPAMYTAGKCRSRMSSDVQR